METNRTDRHGIAISRRGPGWRGPSWRGIAWAVLALLIWAGWFGVTRAGVHGTIGVMDVTALRVGVGTLVLLPAFLPGMRAIPARGWREAVVLSATWGAPFVLLIGRGIQLTSAGHAAGLVPSTAPVIAGLLAWVTRGERPGRSRLLGYAVIAVAVAALTLASAGPDDAAGNAMLLGASVCWAIYMLRVARSGLTPLQATTLTCAYSAIVFLPVYWLSGVSRLSAAPAREVVLQVVFQGVLAGAVATLAFTRAVALLGPARASIVTSLVPVVAMLLAIPLAGEQPGVVELAASAAILVGVLLATRAAQPSVDGASAKM